MMRLLLIVLFGLILGFPGFAQDLSRGSGESFQLTPVSTNKAGNTEGGITLPVGPQSSDVQPIHILPDDSRTSGNTEETVTNAVRDTEASFLLSTGVEYADEGEFEEAERAYLRALKMDPENEESLMRLGSLYVQMKKFKKAVEMFEKLLELNPENPLAHNNLAWCYAVGPDVRNVPLALRHSREALLFAPNLPSVWNTLAEAYYVSGEYDKALRSAEQALFLLQRFESDNEESLHSFKEQISKIKRAQEASKMLMGLSGDNK